MVILNFTKGVYSIVFYLFQLYEATGKELCIVVTNLNHMIEEYCHVKTTPNMPIRLAVRMSMSIPGRC